MPRPVAAAPAGAPVEPPGAAAPGPAAPEQASGGAGSGPDAATRSVWLLQFSSAPQSSPDGTEAFRNALLRGPELARVRDALLAAGHPVEHASGTKLFVEPADYGRAVAALDARKTRSYHLVVDSRYEPLLEAELKMLPYNKRPREKRERRERLFGGPRGHHETEPAEQRRIDAHVARLETLLPP